MEQPAALEASLAFLIKTKVLPYDPATPLLGTYPNELKYYVHTKTYTTVHSSFIPFVQTSEYLLICRIRREKSIPTTLGLFFLKGNGT